METKISSRTKKKIRHEIKTHHPTLYVLANRSDAVFYAESHKAPFHFIQRLANPKARLAEKELVSDRPGRSFSSPATGKARSGLDPRTTQHEELARKFARRIASNLEKIRDDHRFEAVVLVAEPHFLGMLREELSPSLRNLIRQELPREYLRGTDLAIRSRVLTGLENQTR